MGKCEKSWWRPRRCFVLSEISFSGGFYRNRWHLGRRLLSSSLVYAAHSHAAAPATEGPWRPLGRGPGFWDRMGQRSASVAPAPRRRCGLGRAHPAAHCSPAAGERGRLGCLFLPRSSPKTLFITEKLRHSPGGEMARQQPAAPLGSLKRCPSCSSLESDRFPQPPSQLL